MDCMSSDNLRTASLYINNQLLSRGLLRNGQNIEFSRPEQGEGGIEGTMGRVMSVVNDLILRRDRDATQRETLSQTISTLRADSLRQTTDLERLTSKHSEAQRKIGIAEAQERALKQQIRSAEQAARGLKEEMGRMKLLVGQTRSQCANDVRKRERTIEGLKRHVGEGGRARGGSKPVGVISVNVVPGVGVEGRNAASILGVEDSAYDLRSETNEFLTELAKGLSEENEIVNILLRKTLETLRTISGFDKDGSAQEGGLVVQMDSGYENLSSNIEMVLEHLRNLLTNPSFVPLEEVEVREEEIIRLREGWERMETRWRDTVSLMDGWRKRMARSGQTVNLEELKMGLMLSPLKPKEEEDVQGLQLSMVMEEGEGDTQADIDAIDESGIPPPEPDFDEEDDSESSLFEDEPLEDATDDASDEQQPEQDYTLNTETSASPGPPPQLSPLRETSGNRVAYPDGPQKENFTTIVEENTYDLLQLDRSSPQKAVKLSKTSPLIEYNEPTASQLSIPSEDEVSLLGRSAASNTSRRPRSRSSSPNKSSPQKQTRPTLNVGSTPKPDEKPLPRLDERPAPKLKADNCRLPRPRENQLPQQSPLTMAKIAAKLAATEREADAARVRAKLKAARMGKNSRGNPEATKSIAPPPELQQTDDPVKGNVMEESEGRKRKRKAMGRGQGGRASRRRSTLSPWELESLILGGTAASPEKEN